MATSTSGQPLTSLPLCVARRPLNGVPQARGLKLFIGIRTSVCNPVKPFLRGGGLVSCRGQARRVREGTQHCADPAHRLANRTSKGTAETATVKDNDCQWSLADGAAGGGQACTTNTGDCGGAVSAPKKPDAGGGKVVAQPSVRQSAPHAKDCIARSRGLRLAASGAPAAVRRNACIRASITRSKTGVRGASGTSRAKRSRVPPSPLWTPAA